MNCTSTPLIVSTRLLLTLIGLLFTSPEGFTQTFRHFSDADASGMIYSGGQDNKGFMWFATLNGVLRYDSHSFRRFLSKPDDSTSLASNYSTSLLCDSRGDVWVCTSSGLCRYEAGKESFQTFKPNISNPDAIISTDVRTLAEDKHGNIWIGTKDGLDRTETGSGNPKFTHYRLAGPDGTGLAVQGIEKGKNEELWLATSHGLVWFNQGKTKYFLAKADPRLPLINDFTYIFNDQTGNIWLGIRKGGLMRFNITSQTFELLADFKSPVGEWPDLSGFVEDKPGKVWMATTSGLVNFDLKTQQAKWYLNDPANDQSLEDNVLMSITKDRQGGLWLGSYYSRLDYLNTSAPSFSRWPFFNNRITNSKFTSSWMGLTPDQKLWLVSGDKSEILLYDLVSNQLSSHKLKVEFAGNANHFFIDENDVLWYGPAGSLVSYDFKKGTTKVYQAPDFKRVPKEKNDAFIIIQDRHQKLWLGSPAGLLSFDKTTLQFQDWSNDKSVYSILDDSKGNIWFGGRNYAGIIRNGKEKPEQILLNKNATDEVVMHSNVWRITEDRKGRIWLASARGLKRYDPKSKLFKPVSDKFPDLHKGIGDVQADDQGYLWIDSRGGLVRFHPDNETIQSYYEIDGLPKKAPITLRGSFKDKKGTLFFNTNKEMFSFDPDMVSTDKQQTSIVATGLRLFNQSVNVNGETGILSEPLSDQSEIVLRHDQNVFTLDFALPSYTRSHENKYRYKLEGFDKEWQEGKIPAATYMNLPSGKYTFLAYAANGDGLWMKEPLKLRIVVLPPWWKTWYAYAVYIALLGAIAYAIIRFLWIRSSFRKENALNQVKIDFFTNISHEIRTHLSLVTGPLEKAYQHANTDQTIGRYLTYARNNADQLMLLVNELLDFRKMQNGSNRLRVGEHDVVKVIKTVVASFEHLAKEKNIQTRVIAPDKSIMVWFDLSQMQKVFYNLMSNAYKFTPDGGQISARLSELSNEVNIAIEDTGKGMSPEHLKKLFTYYYQADSDKPGYGIGLALSKSIVEQHQGYLYAESTESSASGHGWTKMTIRMLKNKLHFSQDQLAQPTNDYLSLQKHEFHSAKQDSITVNMSDIPSLLIIEDNDELRAFMKEMFSSDYQIIEADNGIQGLEMANEYVPDIILCDVMMPGMSGVEVCNQIKKSELTSHIPVILLTARTHSEQVVEGLSSGADDYVFKPFDPRILELKISNLVRLRDELKKRYQQALLPDHSDIDASGITAKSIADDVNGAFINKLKGAVMENMSNTEFGVNDMALHMGMSVSVLYKKMRSLTGTTVNDFVKTYRLHEAKKLLESGVYQVNEVSTIVGFDDSKYFSKEFRKAFGKTPMEIKKNGFQQLG